MSGWIKLDKDMVDDPRVMEIAHALREAHHLTFVRDWGAGGENLSVTQEVTALRNAVIGGIVTLWRYAHDHIRNDDRLAITLNALNAVIGIEGFCELLPADWLIELDDGTVQLPGYCCKNHLIGKEKRAADNAARQAAWRARQKQQREFIGSHEADNNTSSNAVTNGVTNNEVTAPRLRLNTKTEIKKSPLPPKGGARDKTEFPPEFALDDVLRQQALQRAMDCDVEVAFESFRAHHLAHGTKLKNWRAAWVTWIGNFESFGYPKQKPAEPGLGKGGWR